MALDSSKVKANASKHKATIYARMKNDEHTLRKKVKKLLDAYIATDRQKHVNQGIAFKRDPLPKGATRMDRMKWKLQTKSGARDLCRTQVDR